MFRVDLLQREHDQFLAEHSAMVSGAVYDAGLVAQAEVATHPGFTPRTGDLQRATKTKIVRTSGGRLLRISNDKSYAAAIELGSRPHTITARNAKALRYVKNGIVFYRRRVNHPGNKPYRFLERSWTTAGNRLERMLVDGMTRVARTRFRA